MLKLKINFKYENNQIMKFTKNSLKKAEQMFFWKEIVKIFEIAFELCLTLRARKKGQSLNG